MAAWFVEPTHLKDIGQNGFIFPKQGWKLKFWNHQLHGINTYKFFFFEVAVTESIPGAFKKWRAQE